MTAQPKLIALAAATAPHRLAQDEVAAAVRASFGPRFRDFDRLFPVFANSGIRERQAIRPMAWYREPRGWPERTEAYLEGAVDLFERAARAALDRAGLEAAAVDAVVTVSSTGIATPSLEARAMARLGFRVDVERTPIFGLGCAGGVTGMARAARLAAARPGEVVLLVVVELCTLAFRLDEMTSANLVATALFGDGAAACVVSTAGAGRAQITGWGEHTWPDTLSIMGWRVDPEGFGVIFDRSIPAFVVERLREGLEAVARRCGLDLEAVGRFVCHPGGAKVLQAIERALDLGQGTLDAEREVLAGHGNMSAPTALFVLERVVDAGPTGRPLLLSALGPGFTVSGVALAA